jgi:hypothetical protein
MPCRGARPSSRTRAQAGSAPHVDAAGCGHGHCGAHGSALTAALQLCCCDLLQARVARDQVAVCVLLPRIARRGVALRHLLPRRHQVVPGALLPSVRATTATTTRC